MSDEHAPAGYGWTQFNRRGGLINVEAVGAGWVVCADDLRCVQVAIDHLAKGRWVRFGYDEGFDRPTVQWRDAPPRRAEDENE